MEPKLRESIAAARLRTMSVSERATQRQSFAYGNLKAESDAVTRPAISEAAAHLDVK